MCPSVHPTSTQWVTHDVHVCACSQERVEKGGQLSGAAGCRNPDLEELDGCLEQHCLSPPSDPFMLYLRGVVLIDRKRPDEAKRLLMQSVAAFPCNWSAWQVRGARCSR